LRPEKAEAIKKLEAFRAGVDQNVDQAHLESL
jgi:hypothetical protein